MALQDEVLEDEVRRNGFGHVLIVPLFKAHINPQTIKNIVQEKLNHRRHKLLEKVKHEKHGTCGLCYDEMLAGVCISRLFRHD